MTDVPSSMTTHVQLKRRPQGVPVPEDFERASYSLADLTEGEALTETLYFSVDPYMRLLMKETWVLGAPLEGRAIGRVIASRSNELPVGTLIFHRQGWRTHAVVSPGEGRVLRPAAGIELATYLSLLGGTGLTAYVGVTKILEVKPVQTVFISAAAGGVGVAAAQIARLSGASRLIGSTGSEEKARYLKEQGLYDEVVNYRTGPIMDSLKRVTPDGIDAYFDNVGGDHLEAAIAALNKFGRIAWCGAIAQYNQPGRSTAAPRNLYDVHDKSLRLEGFWVTDYADVQSEYESFMIPHLQTGRAKDILTVTDGLESAIPAFIGLFRGDNLGKVVVRL